MISEEKLRRAAEQHIRTLADSLPEPEECRHEFSRQFEQKMEKVIRRANHPAAYRAMHRAAGFILALLIGSSVWLTVDAEAREAVFGWISDQVNGAYHYFFSGEVQPQKHEMEYTLSEIPAGYREEDTFKLDNYAEIVYVEETTGNYLTLGWIHPQQNGTGELFFDSDTNELTLEYVRVNGRSAEYYCDQSGGNVIVWQDKDTDTLIYIFGFFDRETLIGMAEGVYKK